MVLRYLAYLPANIALVLFAYVLSPFLAAWSMKHGPVLSGRWRWFSTLNADLDGYIPQRVAGFDPAAKGFKLWWQRTRWTWRNPCNGWQSELLGMPAAGSIVIEEQIGTEPKRQWYVMETANGVRFFCFKRDQPLIGGWYLKIWLGWLNKPYDGRNHHYAFQIGPKRR